MPSARLRSWGRARGAPGPGLTSRQVEADVRARDVEQLVRRRDIPQTPNVANTAFRGDAQAYDRQLARLARVKAERDASRVARALAEVDRATAEDRNTVPAVLEAVRAYATVGEIVDVWRRRFGNFVPATDF